MTSVGKKKDTYTFLGKDYPMDRAVGGAIEGDRLTPVQVGPRIASKGFRAWTTEWFDDHVTRGFDAQVGTGRTSRAAIRDLDRSCIREFKRMAKACGYTVTG